MTVSIFLLYFKRKIKKIKSVSHLLYSSILMKKIETTKLQREKMIKTEVMVSANIRREKRELYIHL